MNYWVDLIFRQFGKYQFIGRAPNAHFQGSYSSHTKGERTPTVDLYLIRIFISPENTYITLSFSSSLLSALPLLFFFSLLHSMLLTRSCLSRGWRTTLHLFFTFAQTLSFTGNFISNTAFCPLPLMLSRSWYHSLFSPCSTHLFCLLCTFVPVVRYHRYANAFPIHSYALTEPCRPLYTIH